MEIKEFKQYLYEQTKLTSSVEGTDEKEEYLDFVISMLTDAEELNDDFIYLPYETIGSRRRKIQIDGYCYNELDEYLSIFASTSLSEEEGTLTISEVDRIFSRAKAMIEDAQFILKNGEESAPGYGLAYDIIHRYKSVKKYCIYLISDMVISKNLKELVSEPINGIPVEYHIWDLSRLHLLAESSTGKEDIIINLCDFSEYGIPCLPASSTEEYAAYLCNMPGNILALLYNTYGGRLLEGNVRSFLQTKGKVNKGIRNTILNDPTMFFAYNNGIAATAYDLKTNLVNGTLYITELKALQIVNGGQTTASLAMALLKDKKDNSEEKIKSIFVPMKLSIVSPEKAENLIPNISRYANSQNKVSDADLWSNHPFHVRMEELSRRIIAPATKGKQYGTRWYYERANGQYRQETYKSTEANKKRFELQNPKQQMFNKTDLAKFMNIYRMLPHVASAGGQKSFSKFADWASAAWEKNETAFNENFFRTVVSMAILFRQSDKLVKSQVWYNSYKANIVAYTISKLIYEVKSKYPEKTIDYKSIWQKQTLSEAWIEQIVVTSRIIYEHLIDENRPVENVTEWAKREMCWEKAKDIKLELSQEFVNELIDKVQAKEQQKDAVKDQKLTNKVNAMVMVANFGVQNWKELLEWENTHKVLNHTDISFINIAISMEKGNFPSEKQCGRILKILDKAREEGFPK